MILKTLKSSLVRLFGVSVIGQVMLSLSSFAVGLLLIRNVSDMDYGSYILAQSAIQLALTVSGAWMLGPLLVIAPKRDPETRLAIISKLNHDLQRFLLILFPLAVLASIGALLCGLITAGLVWIVLATILAITISMQRDFLKVSLLIYSSTRAVFWTDMVYAFGLILMVWIACTGSVPAAPTAVLGVAVGAAASGLVAHRFIARNEGWQRRPRGDESAPAAVANIWREMRPLAVWSTVGAATYWSYGQGYNSLLAIQLSVAAVAAVGATRLLLMPTYVLAAGINSLMITYASRWLHERGLGFALRRLTLILVAISFVSLCYMAVLWFSRDWIAAHVLEKDIPQLDALILLWGLLSSLFLVREVYQAALLALEWFRVLAALSAVCTASALAVIWLAVPKMGVVGALWGLIVGETLSLVGTLALLYVAWNRAPRSATGGVAGGS